MQEIVSLRLDLEVVDKIDWLRKAMHNPHTDSEPSRREVIQGLIEEKYKDMITLQNSLRKRSAKNEDKRSD